MRRLIIYVMAAKMTNSPRVLISYSHDSPTHKERVLDLADRLRANGVDCHIDEYEMAPRQGWARWMNQQIEDADFVLAVCTEIYAGRFSGRDNNAGGLGAKWEGGVITQQIYEDAHNNEKFIPVIFSQEEAKFRPMVLRPVNYYNVGTEDGYEDLYRRLTNQPATLKPELGAIKPMPPRRHRQQTAKPALEKSASDRRSQAAVVLQDDYDSLVLLMNKQRQYQLIPSARVEADAVTKLHLTLTTPQQIAFLSGLRDSHEKFVGVAFGINALAARVENVTQLREGGKEIWTVTLQADKNYQDSGYLEISFNGWSPDDIAELRARRILLNEQSGSGGVRYSATDRLNAGLIEHYIQGRDTFLGDLHSPFLDLYAKLNSNPPYFLAAARLFAVLYLRLAGVVQHVLKLDLTLQDETKLGVRFEGQRRQYYSNVEPLTIKVKGHCMLVDIESDDED